MTSIQNELSLLFLAHRKLVLNRYLEIGLTSGQPRILVYLCEHNGCNQKELARIGMVEPSTMTSALKNLEKKGMVRREVAMEDKRETQVYITQEGLEKAKLVRKMFQEFDDVCFQGFTPE